MLNLHNLSEEVANSERERQQRLGEVARGPVKTTNGTPETLLDAGIPADTIFKCLCEQTVDLVFTAHPTQALRRSMLKNFAAIRSELDRLHRMRLSRYERLEVQARARACAPRARAAVAARRRPCRRAWRWR
jgi:phosphoenolpyruvate carboxylase